jgi:hypothetical protein
VGGTRIANLGGMTPTIRIGQAALACFLVASGSAAQAARRTRAFHEPEADIRQLTAGPGAVYAIRGGEVQTFDERGAVIARCRRFAAPPPPIRHALAGAPDAAETLHASGFPEDDSTLAAEELLEDEGPPPRRRELAQIGPTGPLSPQALAADEGGVWIATSDGLFRGGSGGCRRVALAGHDLVAVATDGTTVAAASRELLFRGEVGPIGMVAFGPPMALTDAPRALAVDRQSGVLIAGDGGLLRLGAGGEVARLLDRPTEALAACGSAVLALTDDAVVLWDGLRAARVAPRPPVKVVACGADPQPGWIAGGVGVWTSTDATVWTEHPAALGLDIQGVACLAGTLWVAGEDGLAPLQPRPWANGRPDGLPRPGPEPLPVRRHSPRAPGPWRLPIVTAAILVEQTPVRRTVTGMLLFTLPWDRAPGHAGDASDVAAQALRQDAVLARAEVALAQAAADTPEPTAADEAAARLAAVREEREASP